MSNRGLGYMMLAIIVGIISGLVSSMYIADLKDRLRTSESRLKSWHEEATYRGGYIEGMKDRLVHKRMRENSGDDRCTSQDDWYRGYRQGYKDVRDNQTKLCIFNPCGVTTIGNYEQLK